MVEKKEIELKEGKSFQLIIASEDEEEIEMYLKAPKMSSCLFEISQKLRALHKYGILLHIKTPEDMLEHIMNLFWENIREYGIDL